MNLKYLIAGFVSAGWAAAALGDPVTDADGTAEKNIVYGMHSGTALLLDVHRPAAANGIGVMFIQGSGWQAPLDYDAPQLKTFSGPGGKIPETLLDAGFTVFSINHRATPTFRHPAQINDARRAFRFIHDNAERFGVDPERLVAVGASSGGHLATMVGLQGAAPADADNELTVRPGCVVSFMAPYDLLLVGQESWGMGLAASFIGHPAPYGDATFPGFTDFAAPFLEASPTRHVTPEAPPFLIIHGDKDELVPIGQALAFHEQLAAEGVSSAFIQMPETAHAVPPEFAERAAEWLAQDCLKLTAVN